MFNVNMKRVLMRLTTRIIKAGIQLFGASKAPEISYRLAEELIPTVSQKCDIGTIYIFCPGRSLFVHCLSNYCFFTF